MLPRELLRARRRKGFIRPVYAADDKLSLAKTLISVYQENIGRGREKLGDVLASCEELGYNYKLVRGLAAVLEERSTFETQAAVEPAKVRLTVFKEAGNRVVATEVDRRKILSTAAFRLGISTKDLETSLYADLWNEHILVAFDPPEPLELLKKYNFASTLTLLTEAHMLKLAYMGVDKDLERLENRIGGHRTRTSDGFTEVVIKRQPSRRKGRQEERLERLVIHLMLMEAWRLEAEVGRASRSRRTHILKLSKDSDGNLITPDNLGWILKPEPRRKTSILDISLGDIVIIEELASRLGVTTAKARKRLESSGRSYVNLGDVYIDHKKLVKLDGAIESETELKLSDAVNIIKELGCNRPLPVLEALGYAIEWAEDKAQSRVYKLHKRRITARK
jgi:predicted nuclease of restriction endonuclease-like RecB superfamily